MKIKPAIKIIIVILVSVNAIVSILHFSKLKSNKENGGLKLSTEHKYISNDCGKSAQVFRIIHQSWKTDHLPKLFVPWSKSFSDCMPNYKRILWTDSDNRKLIAQHYAWFLPKYDSFGNNIQRADIARLFYMYHYGGVYCDLDCECMQNFEHLLVNRSLVFGAMQGWLVGKSGDTWVSEGHIENSFMYSRPGHPMIWSMISKVNSSNQPNLLETGINLIMREINSARKSGLHKAKLNDGQLPYFTIYPPQMFNPISWIIPKSENCRALADFDDAMLQKCRQLFVNKSDTYIVQYHTQVWDKGRKNVFKYDNQRNGKL